MTRFIEVFLEDLPSPGEERHARRIGDARRLREDRQPPRRCRTPPWGTGPASPAMPEGHTLPPTGRRAVREALRRPDRRGSAARRDGSPSPRALVDGTGLVTAESWASTCSWSSRRSGSCSSDQALAARANPEARLASRVDLYVRVRVQRRPFVGRAGHDLTLELPVTYPEAALVAGGPRPDAERSSHNEGPRRDAQRQDVQAQGASGTPKRGGNGGDPRLQSRPASRYLRNSLGPRGPAQAAPRERE